MQPRVMAQSDKHLVSTPFEPLVTAIKHDVDVRFWPIRDLRGCGPEKKLRRPTGSTPNNSLDASGGSVFRNLVGPAMLE